ncbi:fimbrial protein [Xenorhabdus doucetiae]|uniref:Putative Fimbrial protein n=1 Tax=Xenorhabdus doucetiae TaxID=351671 RepID=A0A068QSR9_9GAMM|nr:fimbrial protein [Xenorhabdus doucetiae]TYO95010.1 type 1 fimbria pilin [Xenorhabdus doucetiae]CDG18043.1 putative Fimbrial protein precursor [Xenorhabdus doucetiae]
MNISIPSWLLFVPLFFSPCVGYAYADVSCTAPLQTLSSYKISLPVDAPVGQELEKADNRLRLEASPVITCQGKSLDKTEAVLGIKAYGVPSTTLNGRKIFLLGNSGIGYAIRGLTGYPHDRKYVRGENNSTVLKTVVLRDHGGRISVGIALVFYRVGQVKPGQYPPQLVATATVNLRNLGGKGVGKAIEIGQFSTGNIVVESRSCTLDNNSIPVVLESITSMQLPKVSSTAAEKAFDIPLNCNERIKVNMLLQAGSQGAYDPQRGIIKLNPNANTASGVGIQILDGKKATPIPLGQKIEYARTRTEGPVNIPLKARYYRYGDVKEGTVNATATFIMSYE